MAGERVVLVDDDVQIQKVARLALERVGGMTVWCVSRGEEALAIVAREAPELVLLDVMMPGLDGPATLAALDAQGLRTGRTIIFLTARTGRTDVEHLRALGADGVIEKPFDPRTLAREVREIAGEAGRR